MIGKYDTVYCECGWKGMRMNLALIPRYDGYTKDGEPVWIEDYYGCPVCLNEDID